MNLSRDQEIYEEISFLLIKSVAQEAAIIKLRSRVGDDYLEPRYHWYNSSNSKKWFDPCENHRKISELTWELRELLPKINNSAKFKFIEINIFPQTGKFEIDLKYEDVSFDD